MTTIVMTGGTSGLGKFALCRMLNLTNKRIILGALREGPIGPEYIPLDLSSLDQVRSFASEVCRRVGGGEIEALVFNAGVQQLGGSKTVDGFETTFAVNHLAHYLLLRLLMPNLASGARIILTTSGTYDPAEKTIIPPPMHADARLLAFPEQDPHLDKDQTIAGGRAYSSSKLCVVLTARYLATSPEALHRNWTVIAYDPGPTPGTGLVRNNNPAVRFLWYLLGTRIVNPSIFNMNSIESAGNALAEMALGKISVPEGRVYGALRRGRIIWPELSELGRRDDLMEALWKDSATLVKLPEKDE